MANIANARDDAVDAEGNEERRPLLQRAYLDLRDGRVHNDRSRCTSFLLAFFKYCFCLLGLWGHQAWNYVPRVLVSALCIYQAVYDFYVVLGCHGFDCGFLQNSTDKKPAHHKDDRQIANAVYTIVSLAAILSYILFIGSFILAKSKDDALLAPSDTMTYDLLKKDIYWLSFTFVLIIALYLCSVIVFYAIIWSQPRNSYFNTLATGVAAQFFAQGTAIISCHVFAVSSFTLGTFAQDAFRKIKDLTENHTLDDIITIHEKLCKVVFSTVSTYSVWFVVHWLSYGAGVVLSVIYISKEFLSRVKYGTRTLNLVYLCLFFVCHLYLFLVPCFLAARITSCCTGIYEKINKKTSGYWNEGHPFKDRRNIVMFISYVKDRQCGFKIGRIRFNTSLAWLSVFCGLTGLLYHFF